LTPVKRRPHVDFWCFAHLHTYTLHITHLFSSMFKNHGDATHLGFQAARTFPLIPHPQAFCPLLRTTLLPPTPLSTNQGHETARKQLVELRLAHSAGPLSTFTCQRDTKTVSRTYISCRPGLLWTRIPSPFFISLVPRVHVSR
jgi:hypothetical protein